MSILNAIFLGFVQGVAEFLPISSSGHLAVLQNVFNLQTAEEGHMFFDVLLHFGTLISIMIVYWKDIVYIVSDTVGLVRSSHDTFPEQRTERPGARMLLMLFFGTLPLFIILPFHDSLEQLYYKTGFIGAAFLLNGCLLYVSDRIVPGRGNERSMRIRDALLIGCAQAVATIPGISRSGSTITAGIATAAAEGLSIPGLVGTARNRIVTGPDNGLFRVKTGSLDAVTSLTGNVSRVKGGVLSFAVIVNDPENQWSAIEAINVMAAKLAKL